MKTKTCTKCEKTKSITEFRQRKDRPGQYRTICRTCYNKYARNYKGWKTPTGKKNAWKSHLRARYGITPDIWNKMFQEQQGRCAICGVHQSETNKKFHTDHNHETQIIRGLLCEQCNLQLGRYECSYKWYRENKTKVSNYLASAT